MKTCPVCDTPYSDQHATCPTDGAVLIESWELRPGHIVRGKYRIVSKLGEGGMGVVYLAEHLMLGGQVALKFLARELSRNPQFIRRFRHEARAAYLLRHPNIAEVMDLDQETDGSLFIAMEYVAGPSLRAALSEAPRGFSVERALRITCGLTEGLVAAHTRGAIHRDIKPENILLASSTSGLEQPKILDFGIAALTESVTNLGHTKGLLLTPEYAAPEQWRGTLAAELDGRTDLYALGGVFYEMLAGRPPFHAHNMEGWMYQHLQSVPEPLGKLRPDLVREYPALEAIIMRLLAKERELRLDSAATLLEVLVPKPAATYTPTVIQFSPTLDSNPEPTAPPSGVTLLEPESKSAPKEAKAPPVSEAVGRLHTSLPSKSLVREAEVHHDLGSVAKQLQKEADGRTKTFGVAGAILVFVVLVTLFLYTHRSGPSSGATSTPKPNTMQSTQFDSQKPSESTPVPINNPSQFATQVRLLRTLEGHTNYVWCVAFSPDSRTLASGSTDHTIKLWDVATGQLLSTLHGHTGGVNSVVFSPDGKTLASGSYDKTIKVWDVGSGNLLNTLQGHTSYVFSVAFSPDGRILASGSEDKTIKLWDIATGQLLRTLEGGINGVTYVAFSSDDRILASGNFDDTIKLWDAASGQLLRNLEGHTKSVISIGFSPDGRLLASGSSDHTIKLWDVASGDLVITLEDHLNIVHSVSFSPDGRTLASGSADKSIKLWDVPGTFIPQRPSHAGDVSSPNSDAKQ